MTGYQFIAGVNDFFGNPGFEYFENIMCRTSGCKFLCLTFERSPIAFDPRDCRWNPEEPVSVADVIRYITRNNLESHRLRGVESLNYYSYHKEIVLL